jgi:hypothetical protein
MQSVIMMSVIVTECRNDECYYGRICIAESCYAECIYADSRIAKCYYAECRIFN